MFHPDLRLLRSFAAVAAESSVTRAAERLHLTQPTVSGQLRELEQEVGFPLFHRTTRSIKLTIHGARILPLVQEVLARAEALREEVETMQSSGRTHFRLGAAMYSMDIAERAELLDAFAEAMPQISYAIDNRLQSAQIPDLVDEKLDVSVLLGIKAPPPPVDLVDPNRTTIFNETQYPDTLERVVLRSQPMNLLVPVGSPLANFEIIPKAALSGLRIATLNHEHGNALTDSIEAFFTDCGAEPVIPAEGNAFAVERYAERNGIPAIGIGWFPVSPGLVPREVEGMALSLEFAVVLGNGANRAAKQFFAFARDWQAARDGLSSAA